MVLEQLFIVIYYKSMVFRPLTYFSLAYMTVVAAISTSIYCS